MKKFIISLVLAICLIVPSMFMVTACKPKGSAKTMELSVNPDIYFVVDENNKISSVSFKNDDAGVLYANIDFVGKDVNYAVKVVMQIASISGHINFDGTDVDLNIQGSVDADVKKLQEQVTSQIQSVFDSLGVTVQINAKQLSAQAKHTALVSEAYLLCDEYVLEDLQDKTDEELIKIINNKQKQYEGLVYSQVNQIKEDLKSGEAQLYSQLEDCKKRIEAYKAEIKKYEDAIKESVNDDLQSMIDIAKNGLSKAQELLDNVVTQLNQEKQQLITLAKQQAENVKGQMLTNLKNQITLQKAEVLQKLATAKNENKITQEQYDAWVSLINSYVSTNA